MPTIPYLCFSPPTTSKKQPYHGLKPYGLKDTVAVVSIMGGLLKCMTAMYAWIGLPQVCVPPSFVWCFWIYLWWHSNGNKASNDGATSVPLTVTRHCLQQHCLQQTHHWQWCIQRRLLWRQLLWWGRSNNSTYDNGASHNSAPQIVHAVHYVARDVLVLLWGKKNFICFVTILVLFLFTDFL